MALCAVRLELASTEEFPQDDAGHCYEFIAPLDQSGYLDASEWQRFKSRCSVRHFQPGHAVAIGTLVHMGRGWHFDYEKTDLEDDQRLFQLDHHQIKEGEYLSIFERDGETRPYQVVRVRTLS